MSYSDTILVIDDPGIDFAIGSYDDTDGPTSDPKYGLYQQGKLSSVARKCTDICGFPNIPWGAERGYNVYINNCVDFAVDYFNDATGMNYWDSDDLWTPNELWDAIMGPMGTDIDDPWPTDTGDEVWEAAP